MPEARKAVHAYLTEPVHDALHEFAAEEGISVSGLLEALGQAMIERTETGGPGIDPALVKAARKIDAVRRRRGGS